MLIVSQLIEAVFSTLLICMGVGLLIALWPIIERGLFGD